MEVEKVQLIWGDDSSPLSSSSRRQVYNIAPGR